MPTPSVFVARVLRYNLPDPVAALLADDKVWNSYVKFDKPVILIGQYGSLLVKGDWFLRPEEMEVD